MFQRPESAARTTQTKHTIAVSGIEALAAAITGGIASSPISTAGAPNTPSRIAIVLAMVSASSVGGEISCRLANEGGGLTRERSRAMR